MLIKIETLSENPVKLKESIDPKEWNLDSFDIKFININIECVCSKVSGQVLIEAKVLTEREIVCSRCLEKAKQTAIQDFQLNYDVKEIESPLEISDDLRDEMLLNFPMKVLCCDDCKGICSGCGANLNKEKCSCKKKEI